jgi:hypothetical protein
MYASTRITTQLAKVIIVSTQSRMHEVDSDICTCLFDFVSKCMAQSSTLPPHLKISGVAATMSYPSQDARGYVCSNPSCCRWFSTKKKWKLHGERRERKPVTVSKCVERYMAIPLNEFLAQLAREGMSEVGSIQIISLTPTSQAGFQPTDKSA